MPHVISRVLTGAQGILLAVIAHFFQNFTCMHSGTVTKISIVLSNMPRSGHNLVMSR